MINRSVVVFSIVIDSDRGHTLLGAFQKNYNENLTRDMILNACVCDDF